MAKQVHAAATEADGAEGAPRSWAAVRDTLMLRLPEAEASRLPIDAWLLEAWRASRSEAAAAPTATERAPLQALEPMRALAAQLRALGLALTHEDGQALQLAFLLDCLEPAAPQASCEVALWLRREVLHTAGAPLDHAACLLQDTARRQLGLLGRPACLKHLRALAQPLVPSGAEDHAEDGLELLEERLDRLQLLGLVVGPAMAEAPSALERSAEKAVRLGRAALAPSYRDGGRASWELQRSGLLETEELVGDLFGPLVMVDAASTSHDDACRLFAAVIWARQGDGLQYYREAPIPHDTDDAAAFLLAALQLPEVAPPGREALLQRARQVLRAGQQPDGSLHTWVDLPNVPTPSRADSWFGPRCNGVVGRALRAMALDTEGFSEATVAATARWLTEQAEPAGSFRGSYYPSPLIATSLALQGLVAARERTGSTPAGEAACGSAARWLVRQQRPDGRIGGGALATAHALIALSAAGKITPQVAGEAMAFLCGAQRCDGHWLGDAYFITRAANGQLRAAGFRTLTTALAVAALDAVLRVQS